MEGIRAGAEDRAGILERANGGRRGEKNQEASLELPYTSLHSYTVCR